MSKSKGNVVSPDELVDRYGADALRLYILFMGPADQDKEWQDKGVEGMWRFLTRLWRVVGESLAREAPAEVPVTPLARKAHETIHKVTDDIERRFVFNTPVAAVMELVNAISADPARPGRAVRGRDGRVPDPAVRAARGRGAVGAARALAAVGRAVAGRRRVAARPRHDRARLQVNGKVRDRVQVAAGLPEDELIALARASERVQAHLDGKEPRAIVVPDKLVNLVV